jgi:hypothetical protein
MRTILTAAALLAAAALAPTPVTAEQATCPPHPLTQAHEPWMKMPGTAVDLRTPPPVSATNPLMVGVARMLSATGPAVETGAARVNPLTNRP